MPVFFTPYQGHGRPIPDDIATFVGAFRSNVSGCRETCECGATYYNPMGAWDWAHGELDALRRNTRARSVVGSVRLIRFAKWEFVEQCDCWYGVAFEYARNLLDHAEQITRFLAAEGRLDAEVIRQRGSQEPLSVHIAPRAMER